MKNTILVLTLGLLGLFTIQSCNKENIEPERKKDLQIRFTNIGEDKVKQLIFDGKLIGNLSAGETTRYYSFSSITINKYNSPVVDAKVRDNNHILEHSGYETDENKNDILTLEQIILWSTHENMQDNDT